MLECHGYKTLDIATAFEISNYQGKTPSEERKLQKNTMKFGDSSTDILADTNKQKKIDQQKKWERK